MSDPFRIEAPHVATAEAPVPNWGRLVSSGYGTAAWNRRGADEISQTIPHHLVLFSFRPYSDRESRLGGTRIRTVSAASGSCEIVPAGADYWARWHDDKEVAAFSLSHQWLDRLAQQDLDLPAATVFADALPVMDQRVAMLGKMLREGLRATTDDKVQDLELDSLLNLLGVHLLKRYGVARARKDVGGLSDRQLGQVRAFMSARLAEGVRLDEIARIVGLSSSQLLRSFRKRTGTTPHQYLTRLRLDHARALIVGTSTALAEVALSCGFSSQSHLTAIMRREDGFTPGNLRV